MEIYADDLKKAVHGKAIAKVTNWLLTRPHDVSLSLYNDLDLFAIVGDQEDLFEMTSELSSFAVELTLLFGKHVSIYPIHISDLLNQKNQFLRNVANMSEVL